MTCPKASNRTVLVEHIASGEKEEEIRETGK
jgi:hypothetical protein